MNSPSGKNLSFSYAPLSQNHIEGMLLAYSSCACIHISLKLKILRDLSVFVFVFVSLGKQDSLFC